MRSMNVKDRELIEEMRKYDLRILGVSKTKWKGSGASDIEDYYTIYSGVSEGRARAGVAVVLSQGLRRCVKSSKCVSENCGGEGEGGKSATRWCKSVLQRTTARVRPNTSFMLRCRRLWRM